MHPADLKSQFATCDYVGNKILDGMSHEDSLKQPAMSGNCVNWVLGHIILTRIQYMPLIGGKSEFPENDFARYKQGSPPLTDPSQAAPFEELVDAYEKLQAAFQEGFDRVTAETLAQRPPFGAEKNPDETIGSLLAKIAFHEAYHLGQTGMLRRYAGKPGAVG